MEPNNNSVFFKKYGFYVKLSIVDDPVKARDLFASGHSHVLWGTLDMMALFAPELVKDSRTVPVIAQQIDWSGGGDGVVARGDMRNINDFRMKNGKRRKDVPAAAQTLSKAYGLPVEDCQSMIGKDGGVAEGDAHLTNYRENSNFFLDPMNPSNFEVVWNRASTIYKSLGAIDAPVAPAKVKAAGILAKMSEEYKEVRDLSQPTFKPGALFKTAEADASEILTKSVIISFEPNKSVLNPDYDPTIPNVLEEVGKLAGSFGNAYIVVEGNTDASRKGIVPADLVRQLSYDRADAVRKAILAKYKFDPNKFKVIGNGWDNPVPGMSDPSNPEHNKRNRRVEAKVFPLEKE